MKEHQESGNKQFEIEIFDNSSMGTGKQWNLVKVKGFQKEKPLKNHKRESKSESTQCNSRFCSESDKFSHSNMWKKWYTYSGGTQNQQQTTLSWFQEA